MGGAATARLLVRCPAKINLGLWVLGRRPDGFHEIDTILQTVALEDDLAIGPPPAGKPGLHFESRGRAIPGDGPNLVERAFALLESAGHLPRGAGLSVTLTKRIPIGAGLGGGSSDAAGMLVGTARALGLAVPDAELHALASQLGSDVPFFLRGGTARATGRGERVRHLCPIPPLWIVLASPPLLVSTSWAYEALRKRLTPEESGASILASVCAGGDVVTIASAMRNVFEDVILPQFPEIAALKRALASSGAVTAQLTGSGSAVFGIVPDRERALDVAAAVSAGRAEVRVVRTLERGVIMAARS